jgi:UDP-galactopyranose mutase
MVYDFIIIGAGLFGSTFAREMENSGKSCLIIEKRNHIAGNTYTKKCKGIDVHTYGPHIFHTNSQRVWDYVNQFSEFNNYRHKVKSCYNESLYSFPLNLNTLEELWGVSNDLELVQRFEAQKNREHQVWDNLEEFAISEVGEEIYKKFIYGYTKKQWGKNPRDLPASIIARIPVRTNRNDDYHNAVYSGIPKSGYTEMVKNIIGDIECILEIDYLKERDYWDSRAKRIVFTGPIDEFFNYKYGELEWRSLKFEHVTKNYTKHQPVAQVNYPQDNTEYTRIVEHKHFTPELFEVNKEQTVITYEYPQKYKMGLEKYYPINDSINNGLYQRYKKLINKDKYIFGGRLATYKYYDMDQVIASAISLANKLR